MDVLREKISLPANMMRQLISENKMDDLVKSIKEIGIINAITVRKKGDGYELVAGLRRLMAADMLKMEKVPVKVTRAGEELAQKIMVDENRVREDVGPIDEGIFYQELMLKHKWNQKKLAEVFRVSESYISQRIGAMSWPEKLRKAVSEGTIIFSVAREFAKIRNMDELERVMDQAIRSGVSPAVASRWRHEINREEVETEGLDAKGLGSVGHVEDPELAMSCQVCGGGASEIGYRIVRVCNICVEVIKGGQDTGVFRREGEE